MSSSLSTALFAIALLIALPILVLVIRDRISDAWWKHRNPPEKLEADRRAYEARILEPDWDLYARHLGRDIPSGLKRIFEDRELVLSEGIPISGEHVISSFGALDSRGLEETTDWVGFEAVAVATTDYDDTIYLRPGPDQTDAVYLIYHDGSDEVQLAPSVDAFYERLVTAQR